MHVQLVYDLEFVSVGAAWQEAACPSVQTGALQDLWGGGSCGADRRSGDVCRAVQAEVFMCGFLYAWHTCRVAFASPTCGIAYLRARMDGGGDASRWERGAEMQSSGRTDLLSSLWPNRLAIVTVAHPCCRRLLAFLRACVRACERACVRACVRACLCSLCVCVRACVCGCAGGYVCRWVT